MSKFWPVRKNKVPSLPDYKGKNKHVFKQIHIYSSAGYIYTSKFSQIWCFIFRNNFSKKVVFNLFLFFTILIVQYHLNCRDTFTITSRTTGTSKSQVELRAHRSHKFRTTGTSKSQVELRVTSIVTNKLIAVTNRTHWPSLDLNTVISG